MNKWIRLSRRAILAGLLTLPTAAFASEGKNLAWKHHCITCHGDKGIANSNRYPNLSGQNNAYLVARLRYFRERVEPGNQMNGQAAPLTNEEIDLLAEYFNDPS